MKKLLIFLYWLMAFMASALATTYTAPYCNESTGGYILASHWNGNCSAEQTFLNNGNIDGTTNIGSGAVGTSNIANLSITDAKISTSGISTYGKVNGTSITNLNGLSSAAGEIPPANLGTGTANSTTFLNGSQVWTYPVNMYAYGSSLTTSTTPAATTKIAYGTTTSNATTATITNLPFTSSTSYVCTCVVSGLNNDMCVIDSYISGSSVEIASGSSSSHQYSWVCTGT